MLDGCTLSNRSLLVRVHNISKELMELENRLFIPFPNWGSATSTRIICRPVLGPSALRAHAANCFRVQGKGDQLFRGSVYGLTDDSDGGIYTIQYEDGHRESMDYREFQKSYNLRKDDE
jgi:hypothetical protein